MLLTFSASRQSEKPLRPQKRKAHLIRPQLLLRIRKRSRLSLLRRRRKRAEWFDLKSYCPPKYWQIRGVKRRWSRSDNSPRTIALFSFVISRRWSKFPDGTMVFCPISLSLTPWLTLDCRASHSMPTVEHFGADSAGTISGSDVKLRPIWKQSLHSNSRWGRKSPKVNGQRILYGLKTVNPTENSFASPGSDKL